MEHTRQLFVKNKETRIGVSIFLNFVITFAEIIDAILAGSLSLISDALHNLSDVTSLIISLIAIKLVCRKHTEERTFGYKRAEIIAALFNASVRNKLKGYPADDRAYAQRQRYSSCSRLGYY